MKAFYCKYFNAVAGALYENKKKQFTSYFLKFEDGCRLEIMHRPDVKISGNDEVRTGYVHLAISVGSEEMVNVMTATFRNDGFIIADGPRWTGDGYYESVVLDPEKNRIEITV